MEPGASAIPAPLYTRLLALKPILEQQGVFQLHRDSFRIRYRVFDGDLGYIVQRSLTIGAGEQAAAVRALIDPWREAWRAPKQEKERQRIEAKRQAAERLQEFKLLYAFDGVTTDWRRRQLRAWWKSLSNDPKAAMRFIVGKQLPARHGRGSRPQRLW